RSCKVREHAVRLAKRRVGPLDDRLERLASAREARSQVVENQAEAVRVRLAHDVLHEVEVDLLAVVLERKEVLSSAWLIARDDVHRRRRGAPRSARLSGLAIHVLLAEERLGPDQARGVRAEVLEAWIADVHDDHGL